MDAEGRFTAEVSEKGGHISRPSLDLAIKHYLDGGLYSKLARPQAVRRCIELAGVFEVEALRSRAPGATEGREVTAGIPRTPLARVRASQWLEMLEPRVRFERERMFGSPEPPFPPARWREAVAWIQEQHGSQREKYGEPEVPSDPGFENYRAAQNKLGRAARALSQLTGVPVSSKLMRRHLHYAHAPPPDVDASRIERCLVRGGGPLARLADFGEETSAATGCPPHEVTAWVLSGALPTFRRAAVAGRGSYVGLLDGPPYQAAGWQVVVRLYTPDLRHEDLRALHAQINAMWGTILEDADEWDPGIRPAAHGRVSDADAALLEIVRQLEGPGERHPRGFWRRVAAEWEAADRPAREPESLARRWRRLKKKLT